MNINVASSIFLLACLLLLPADVKCQRHAREEQEEYEIDRHRKRATPIATYFQGANLKKVCGICHHKFDINLQNCISGKKEARYKCLLIAKDNQKFFESHLHGKKHPLVAKRQIKTIVKRAVSIASFFKGANLHKACSICHSNYHINKADCLSGKRKGKVRCMMVAKKNSKIFASKMSGSKAPAAAAGRGGGSPGGSSGGSNNGWVPVGDARRNLKLGSEDEYFKAAHIKRTCTACNACYDGISIDDCVAGKGDARNNCRMTMKEMRYKFVTEFEKAPASRKNIEK